MRYEDVLNDKYIINIIESIEDFENSEYDARADHGRKHAIKVVNIIEKIMLSLNCSKEYIELGKITGILHDIGCLKGKKNHAAISYDMAKVYLEDKDINEVDKDIILSAIFDHRQGDNIQSIIGASLLIADKIDLDKTRILEQGLNVEGFKELINIEKVDVDIIENNLIVDMKTNNKFSKLEFMKYYFIPKAISITKKASEYLGLVSEFNINGSSI